MAKGFRDLIAAVHSNFFGESKHFPLHVFLASLLLLSLVCALVSFGPRKILTKYFYHNSLVCFWGAGAAGI